MSERARPPMLTVAVLHHHLRGYPEESLESLGADAPPEWAEYLLVQSEGADYAAVVKRFPHVRIVTIGRGDRAAAKNRAVAEAAGEVLLLAGADTVARHGAAALLLEFLRGQPGPAVVSAQLLLENGMERRTAYSFPSLLREANLFGWAWRRRSLVFRKGRPPRAGGAVRADALHATFLMARRDTFRQVGEFREGFRFGHEDIEWCRRAGLRGMPRYILTDAQAFKVAPQLSGELPVEARLAMEASLWRLVAATQGRARGELFRRVRRLKSLLKWRLAGFLNRIVGGHSILLAQEARVHRAIWRMPPEGPAPEAVPPDLESHVRWESAV